ncbi:DNA-directed RNA polymerase V subunit 5C-like isoform X2 [Rutidosis leptorrhynchoides]|uniref:DNA-directed RNA polymerase V subunit 5C-like isoform X2 n=1 Tax=Rutidosis leptorrhynchoides TaxID=125765 RepID=UPI003A997C18
MQMCYLRVSSRFCLGDQPDSDQLRICVLLSSKPSKKILVIICGPEEINKAKAIGILLNVMNKESVHYIIIVLQVKMNHYARKEFDSCQVKVEFSLLPYMLESDAFARYYGLEKKQVVKFTYNSKITGLTRV